MEMIGFTAVLEEQLMSTVVAAAAIVADSITKHLLRGVFSFVASSIGTRRSDDNSWLSSFLFSFSFLMIVW